MDSSSKNKKAQMNDEQVPLLVKIQTIEVANLDFRSTISKNKHITYVDGTSRFLFVGCTSGSVYVFSRDSLQFLFIIPFKGGKVCTISCADDETDVAVGSLRGKVAIYRLQNVESLTSTEPEVSSVPCTVKLLYTVSHHTNNEITEMIWSPNGRYLFIGDNQGLISQVDVGSLDEFPRPPPSRVILQIQSRILQLDCIFPYLAVNAVSGVFLCDLENEDFTRIKNPTTRSSIQSTGICLMISPYNNCAISNNMNDISRGGEGGGGIYLYVAGRNNSQIMRYGTQGNLLDTQEVQDNYVFHNEVHLFDPKKQKPIQELNTSESLLVGIQDFKISLGKLFTCDEGYIISASGDRIVIIDPVGMKIILWNDDFRRISSLKVLSNYLFIWETGKFHVLALTSFLAYGQQLYKANLHSVLQNWIQHGLNASGWRKELELIDKDNGADERGHEDYQNKKEEELEKGQEEEREKEKLKNLCIEKSCSLFHSMMHYQLTDYDETFKTFITSHLPTTIAKMLEEETDEVEEETCNDITTILKSQNAMEGDDEEEEEAKIEMEEQQQFPITPMYLALKKLTNSFLEISNNTFSYQSQEEEIQVDGEEEGKEESISIHANMTVKNDNISMIVSLYTILVEFYTEIEAKLPHDVENSDKDSVLYKQSCLNNKMTFDNLIQSQIRFLQQETLEIFKLEYQNSSEFLEMGTIIPKILDRLQDVAFNLNTNPGTNNNYDSGKDVDQELVQAFQQQLEKKKKESLSILSSINYIGQNSVARWLRDFSNSGDSAISAKADAYFAETCLLLTPIVQWTKTSHDFHQLLSISHHKFFTWTVLLLAGRESKILPFGQKLSNFLLEKVQGNKINEIISCVYQDWNLLDEDVDKSMIGKEINGEKDKPVTETCTANSALKVHFLHHFATLLYLKSMTRNSRNKILSALITNFPLKSQPEWEIKRKLLRLCVGNPALVKMYQEACVTDGNSQQLCSCGIPNYLGFPSLFMIPKTQRLIEELILEILISFEESNQHQQLLLLSTPPQSVSKEPKKKSFNFAMQRLLYDTYFQLLNDQKSRANNPTTENTAAAAADDDGQILQLTEDKVQLEIIFRSGQCHLLQKYFPFNNRRLGLVIELYDRLLTSPQGKETCSECYTSLKTLPNYKKMSWDCLGLWILGSSTLDETERLTKVLIMTKNLNTPGLFSLKFYQLLACGKRGNQDEEDDYSPSSTFNFTSRMVQNGPICAALH